MSYTPPPPPPPPPGGGFPPPPPPSFGAPVGGPSGGFQYAELGPRIVAGLIDYGAAFGISVVVWIIVLIASNIATGLGLLASLLYLAPLAFNLWNAYNQGETGQSIGKKSQGLKVVSQENGALIGGTTGIIRALVHILDGFCCAAGYIFGLFIDKDKQTFADKIMKTVVVQA